MKYEKQTRLDGRQSKCCVPEMLRLSWSFVQEKTSTVDFEQGWNQLLFQQGDQGTTEEQSSLSATNIVFVV